ncbi:MAG: Ldh family oxidoreductase [Bryobacteraceae bacterium]
MAGYSESATDRRFNYEDLRDTVAAVFAATGMRAPDARLLATTLAWADVRGIHSHGVLRTGDYLHKLTAGGVDPRGVPFIASERPAAIVVDGANAMGQIACGFAMDRAVGKARSAGVAVAAVRGSNHCGALAWFAMQAIEHNMIGIAATNALPTMAPWGGLDKIVGINPLAIALPAAGESPLVLDCAFSYSSHGKIRVFHQKGDPIPPTWAFDREGHPTTDAAEALEGLLQPIGEYKGVGLAILFGLLSTALSGAGYGTELGNMTDGPHPGADGQFLAAIDIEAFTTRTEFTARVDRAIRQIRDSRRAPGVGALYAPGGVEAEIEARHRRDGIPLNAATVETVNQAAARMGVPGL